MHLYHKLVAIEPIRLLPHISANDRGRERKVTMLIFFVLSFQSIVCIFTITIIEVIRCYLPVSFKRFIATSKEM